MKESDDGARRRRSPQTHASEEAVGETRRHPQVPGSQEGAGVARRHPQVLASQEGAGVAHPGPQIRATGESAGVTCRRGILPAAPASPIEGDDLLREILLRLPPHPSSLLRASAVCRQWRCAATDPKFLQRFRLHHRKPPLLGVFHQGKDDFVFTPTMDRPDRIPPTRFNLRLRDSSNYQLQLLDCRHGRVLTFTCNRPEEFIVSDPVTGEQSCIALPPDFMERRFNGAVLCASVDHDHVHGSCHSSPFNVVLVADNGVYYPPIASVYSSETGVWGDTISGTVMCYLFDEGISGLLVGNALYWLLESISDGMLKFDLDEQSLTVISGPPVIDNRLPRGSHWIIRVEGGAVGFAILSCPHLQMWQMNINCYGVATWVLWKTIDMRTILGLPKLIQGEEAVVRNILGCLEDSDEIILSVGRAAYVVHLKSMKSRKLCENGSHALYHSFKSFYPPGTSIAGGFDGTEMMHDSQGNCLV